jgi:TonB family protein
VTLAPRRTLPVAAVTALLLATRAGAQAPPEGTPIPVKSTASDAEVSPGQAIVQLGAKGALETSRLSEMLRDTRPLNRALAARLVRVLEARALVTPLAAALETETDRTAGAEMATTLGALTSGDANEVLLAAAARFSGDLDGALLRGLGQQASVPAALLRRLGGLKQGTEEWRAFFEWSLGRGPSPLDDAAEAVLAGGNAAAWTGLLSLASATDRTLATALLDRALVSPDESLREATFWYLLRRARTNSVDYSWLARATETSPEARGEGDPMQRLAHELLRRAAGLPPRDQAERLATMTRQQAGRLPGDASILRRLSPEERRACGKVSRDDPDWFDGILKRAPKDDDQPQKPGAPRWMGTPLDLLPELAEEAMAAGGCRIDGTPWALLEVRHDADGRRQGFAIVVPKDVPSACEPVIRGLLLSTLVPPRARPEPGETHLVLMPLEPAYFACIAERSPSPRPPVRPQAGRIAEPKKIRNVAPTYPLDMREKRIQGTVVLESVISTQGCISSTEVVRSVDPYLDVAALRAVSQWRYTPTLLDGVPVPVIMTITVNFKLSY